ncbi:hypothetical protein M1437_01230 [Patescibacteria group bacterium]|nr:hypothetical protein [Patescibacteria group bacterium]
MNEPISPDPEAMLAIADIRESVDLIELSRKIFQEKLAAIRSKLEETHDLKQAKSLLAEAKDLSREYTESLKIIESYIENSFSSRKRV